MRTSARSKTESRGFTLIELLVVLFIIATVSGLLLLTGGDNLARRLEQESRRLHYLLELAAEEAVLQGEQWGWSASETGYGFVHYDAASEAWVEAGGDFSWHDLPPPFTLKLILAEPVDTQALQQQQASARWLATTDDQSMVPALLLFSSGDTTPYEIRLEDSGSPSGGYRLSGDGFNAPLLEAVQ